MRTNYEVVTTLSGTGVPVEYGFIPGSNTTVFIKAGLDGSLRGYEDKYLRIADKLNALYGYSVVVASNPSGGKGVLNEGYNLTKEFVKGLGHIDVHLYYMGFSNGAYMGITEGFEYDFEKYLLINSPLMMNYHKISHGLKMLADRDVLVVYGEKDQSIKYAEMLKAFENENVRLEIIAGADHQFIGMTDEFINLPIEFFKME